MNAVSRPFTVLPILAGLLAIPLAASAQTPSYATGETIRGTISSVDTINHIFVADDRGYTDDVTLRPGAKVLSGGARLEPGVRVTIVGSNGGRTFVASQITTQGRPSYGDGSAATAYAVPVPVPAYYPAPVYYPAYYPYYSTFSVGFGFGFGRYGYGGYGRPFYGGGPYFRGYGGYHPVSVGVGVHIR